MFIRSERLFLRPTWPEDWTDLYAAIADECVVRNLAQAPWPYRVEDAMAFARREQAPLLPHFLITLPGGAGARTVGCIGLSAQQDEVELGYWIAREHWNQGYASEAARAVVRLADALGHRRIIASHFADNPASGKVLAKAGFRRLAGETRRFSLGRGEEVAAIPFVRDADIACGDDGAKLMRAA